MPPTSSQILVPCFSFRSRLPTTKVMSATIIGTTTIRSAVTVLQRRRCLCDRHRICSAGHVSSFELRLRFAIRKVQASRELEAGGSPGEGVDSSEREDGAALGP